MSVVPTSGPGPGPAPWPAPGPGTGVAPTAVSGAPPPPPGPGVQPPFAAPPTDGTRQRRWLAVALAGGAAMVLCVGGLVGLGGVVVLSIQVLRDESVTAVTEFLTAIQDERFGEAYDQLCESVQSRTPRSAFIRDQASGPGITRFTVGEAQLADAIRVPATINYDDRTVSSVHFVMEQDAQTGAVEVCGEED
jgi:hypothetical protein